MIQVIDLAYVRFRVPDLEKMRAFLTAFGFKVSEENKDALYSRGTDSSRYVHVTEQGDTGFRALAFQAESAKDLERIAKAEGASSIEDIDNPGGGHRVTFTDPNGYVVEVVHGIEPLEQVPAPTRPPLNSANHSPRVGQPVRLEKRPAVVKRLGHCVLNVVDFRDSEKWYKDRFGLLTSDEVYKEKKSQTIGAFLRCNRGERFVDHHTLFLVGSGKAGFNHAAFEVQDWDDLMLGHDALQESGFEHRWGVGKHVLGSQVFDYWRDPFGHTLEHFTDGDLFNEPSGSRLVPLEDLRGVQWGPQGAP